jgi:vacuolar-type H+-ATPase subunit H
MDKQEILRRIETDARREAEHLAGEFARAAEAEREAILAEMEYHRWLMECCAETRCPQ